MRDVRDVTGRRERRREGRRGDEKGRMCGDERREESRGEDRREERRGQGGWARGVDGRDAWHVHVGFRESGRHT